MNNKTESFKEGLYLFIVTLILFFGLYLIYSLNGSISNAQYFKYTVMINSFVLTFLYAGVAFFCVFQKAKIKSRSAKEEIDYLQFPEAFKTAIMPMLIGGISSVSVIFAFMNTSGKWVQKSLQDGMIKTFMTNMDTPVDDEKKAESIKQAMKQLETMNVNLFTLGKYFTFIAVLLLFYVGISFIFAMFLKKRKI